MPSITKPKPKPKPKTTVPSTNRTPRANGSHTGNGKAKQDDKPKVPKVQQLFEALGCDFAGASGKDIQAQYCPFCDGEKFYLNVENGKYTCHRANTCGATGNQYTFIRHVYDESLSATTDDDYRRLKEHRDLPLQTLKRHRLAWHRQKKCWLVPYKSPKGEVLTLLQYYPQSKKGYLLPGLGSQLYGLDQLSGDKKRITFLCEGPWDAIALDQHFRSKKSRRRYDILAVPGAKIFKADWFERLNGRKVRLCFDNDKAGREGQQRIVKLARENKVDCKLFALEWPNGYPEKCDIRNLVHDGQNIAEFTEQHCVKTGSESRIVLTRGDKVPDEEGVMEWMWRRHIQFSSFASMSGKRGTQKSTVVRDLTARGTAGRPMPCEDKVRALAPFNVLYFTSEDSRSSVCDSVRIHGGNLELLHIYDIAIDGPIDLIEEQEQFESLIRQYRARFVVIDALNSFIGGDISTDSKARRTLTGPLQSAARRTGACILGIRNWGRLEHGTPSQKALGATSLSDVPRCVMNTQELEPFDKSDKTEPKRFQLEFERITNAPQPSPIGYSVKDLSTDDTNSHHRKIVWVNAEALSKKWDEKGSTKR